MLLKMVARKTKEDRSVRETQPIVLPVKQKESLSYMNFREFTYIYINVCEHLFANSVHELFVDKTRL